MLRALVVILALSCTSCQTLRKWTASRPKPIEQLPADGPQAIGAIEMVNPETGFVLGRLAMNRPLSVGGEVSCIGANGQVTKLKVTPERKGLFFTADIVSGTPHKGDVIYLGTASAAAATPPDPAGPPSAANPPSISISPASPNGAPLPFPAEPAPLTPGATPTDFLRIVPR